MADYVLGGLIKRRAELAGEVEEVRRRLLEIDAALLCHKAAIGPLDLDVGLLEMAVKVGAIDFNFAV